MRNKKNVRLSSDMKSLINLADAIAQASNRSEDNFWQKQLDRLVEFHLQHSHQATLDKAIQALLENNSGAYEVLVETLESLSATQNFVDHGQGFQCSFLIAPILAYTRFDIPYGKINLKLQQQLASYLQVSILSKQARLILFPNLYAIEQLPRHFVECYQKLAEIRLNFFGGSLHLPELSQATTPYLADTRYLMAAILAPANEAVFSWQDCAAPYAVNTLRQQALQQWRDLAQPVMQQLLPGCGVELLMPESFYTACREADAQIRPVAVNAALFNLCESLNKRPDDFEIVIAPISNPDEPGLFEEFRISFCLKNSEGVVYGVVWPLYRPDEHYLTLSLNPDEEWQGALIDVLRNCGLSSIHVLSQALFAEHCDDCGSPLFADKEGELVHAEMPEEELELSPAHFH